MSEELNLAEKYRKMVHAGSTFYDRYDRPLGRETEELASFRIALEQAYMRGKEYLRLSVSQEDEESIASDRSGLLLIGVGLLTYGRLDVVEDILNGIPTAPQNMRHLAGSIKDLLPLPRTLDPFENPEEVKNWVQLHEARLRWSEESGKFLLEDE
jgi:hypothetical protein